MTRTVGRAGCAIRQSISSSSRRRHAKGAVEDRRRRAPSPPQSCAQAQRARWRDDCGYQGRIHSAARAGGACRRHPRGGAGVLRGPGYEGARRAPVRAPRRSRPCCMLSRPTRCPSWRSCRATPSPAATSSRCIATSWSPARPPTSACRSPRSAWRPSWFLAKKLLEVAGPVTTRRILLLGDPLPAQRLYDLGVISHIAEPGDLDRVADAVIERLATNAPLSLKAMKALIVREMAFRDAIAHEDVDGLVEEVRRSADAQEGIAARLGPAQARLQGAIGHGDPHGETLDRAQPRGSEGAAGSARRLPAGRLPRAASSTSALPAGAACLA